MLRRALVCLSLLVGTSAYGQDVSLRPDPDAVEAQRARILALRDRLRDGEGVGALLGEDFVGQSLPQLDRAVLDDVLGSAMDDPRARAAIGLDAPMVGDMSVAGGMEESPSALVFASFSMPGPSMIGLMEEAERLGVPVILRGFVNNSVFDTQAKLAALFDVSQETPGMSVDPTLFRLFDIQTVPIVVVLAEALPVCETPFCIGDTAPAHDRLAGNIPLKDSLALIAQGGGEAAGVAASLIKDH